MRRSTIIGAVLVGGLALAGCSPSYEPSDAPPAPGTPPAHAPQGGGDQDSDEQDSGDQDSGESTTAQSTTEEFQQQLATSQQRTVELAELGQRNPQDARIADLAGQIQQQAQSKLDELSADARQSPEDAALDRTEGLPSTAEIEELAAIDGADFDQQWISTMRDLQQFTLQLANNQAEGDATESDQQAEQPATDVSAQTQDTLSELDSLQN